MSARLAASVAAYIASIVAANVMTSHLGLVGVGFGLLVTAGTFAAGFALVARDFVHRYGGARWALAAITVGAVLSWFLATPALAVASTIAFAGAELADLLVYAGVRKRFGFPTAVVASNVVSAPVDTVLFLAIAGFPLPKQGIKMPEGAAWCADNGCFGKGYPGDAAWWEWLASHDGLDRCEFAVAPDVVGDAVATLARSRPWLARIRGLGVPAAFVAQDRLEETNVPWDEFDVLFIGGSTEWKLGPVAREAVAEAKRRGKRVHMGRVNSYKRLSYADAVGCDSADGTFLTFGPDVNLGRLSRWLERVDGQLDYHQAAAPL